MINSKHIPISIIPDDFVTKITPVEFELLVKNYLDEIGNSLQNFKTVHNVNIQAHDGNYQIDVLATFTALNVAINVLVECKYYTSSIKREKVQLVYDKLRAIGAHKGIIFSTSGFQQGAIEYAQAHGIALVRILPGSVLRITNSTNKTQLPTPNAPRFVGELIYGHKYLGIKETDLTALTRYLLDAIL